jgi:hypothetical protein
MAYVAVIDGGCPVPTVTNEAERPPLYSGECPVSAQKEPKTLKMRWAQRGRALV